MNLLKRWSAPVIYFLFLWVHVQASISSLIFYERTFGLGRFFWRLGAAEFLAINFLVSIFSFGLANHLMQKLEKIQRPSLLDHFRQSALIYLVLTLSAIPLLKYPLSECQTDCHGLLFIYAPIPGALMAILVNLGFLYKMKRSAEKEKL